MSEKNKKKKEKKVWPARILTFDGNRDTITKKYLKAVRKDILKRTPSIRKIKIKLPLKKTGPRSASFYIKFHKKQPVSSGNFWDSQEGLLIKDIMAIEGLKRINPLD